MGDMYDAVDPANIPAECDGHPALRITVLANPAGEAFDFETGNAGADAVALACRNRVNNGQWCVGYVNESNHGQLGAALVARALPWSPASEWPKAGVYMWAAAPGTTPGEVPAWCGTEPIAVQDRAEGSVDISTTFGAFDAQAAGYIDGPLSRWPAEAWARFTTLPDVLVAPEPGGAPTGPVPDIHAPPPPPMTPPAPAPQPAGGLVTVLVPQLQENNTGDTVRAAQQLLGGLAVDGVFGPLTLARAREYQSAHGLAPDGIIGVHTWGALLGHPQ